MENRRVSLQDINTAAFLQCHNIVPELKLQSGRVVFEFTATDEFYRLMEEYNANRPTPIVDFVNILRRLRSQMLTMKPPVSVAR
jgi:hypothetical protein